MNFKLKFHNFIQFRQTETQKEISTFELSLRKYCLSIKVKLHFRKIRVKIKTHRTFSILHCF